MAGLTPLQALRDKGQIQPGQKVWINGAVEGVVRRCANRYIIWRRGYRRLQYENVEMVRSIGADKAIDYTRDVHHAHGTEENVSHHAGSGSHCFRSREVAVDWV